MARNRILVHIFCIFLNYTCFHDLFYERHNNIILRRNEYNYLVDNKYSLYNFSICNPAGSKNVLRVGALDHFYKYNALIASVISSKKFRFLE